MIFIARLYQFVVVSDRHTLDFFRRDKSRAPFFGKIRRAGFIPPIIEKSIREIPDVTPFSKKFLILNTNPIPKP